MKRILVPVDFSEEAKCAIKAAANIARKTDSEIYLLHMVDLPEGIIDAQSGADNSSPASILYMKKIHERFQDIKNSPELNGLTVHEKVQFQKAFDGVIEESKNEDIDLIVMGSSGASGIKEIIIGSNTEKVVRHSDVPVLVVKKGSGDLHVKHIVFASDFGDESKNRFQDVIDFAKIFDATLHLLYVNTPHN
ncbi:MAG TPA: universal stress protein, partial [Flavobacteriia bacterium]|nr:universal stress protein [Flavobacteriia bacterium]